MDLQSSMTHGARDLDMEVFQKSNFCLDICRVNPKDVLHMFVMKDMVAMEATGLKTCTAACKALDSLIGLNIHF